MKPDTRPGARSQCFHSGTLWAESCCWLVSEGLHRNEKGQAAPVFLSFASSPGSPGFSCDSSWWGSSAPSSPHVAAPAPPRILHRDCGAASGPCPGNLHHRDLPSKCSHLLTSTWSASMASFNRVARNALQKSPNDVVLLSAVRSPINRSFKGGFKDAHPEDILMPVRRQIPTQQSTPLTVYRS